MVLLICYKVDTDMRKEILMKRSEINAVIKEFEAMLAEYRFALPPYLSFTPEEWAEKGHEYDEIRDNALGWDVTDYGEGHYDRSEERRVGKECRL